MIENPGTRGCITGTTGMLTTFHQLGGAGIIYNKGLVVPVHFGDAVHSIEYVQVSPGASVGQHIQKTDEIYYILAGVGTLTTNGEKSQVEAGDLVIAPRGTQHAIANEDGKHSLTFLVIEVATRTSTLYPPCVVKALPTLYQPADPPFVALVGQKPATVLSSQVNLAGVFSGPWGLLSLLELPPGCRVEEYTLPATDENLFIFPGCSTLLEVDGHPFVDGCPFDEDFPFLSDEMACDGVNAFIPAGVPHRFVNRSSVAPLRVLSVQFQRPDAA